MKAKKLKSGNWNARAYDYTDTNGKKHYKSFTSSSKKEAERLAMAFEEKRKYYTRPENITLGVAVDKYIELRKNVLSESTIYGYEKIRRTSFNNLFEIRIGKLNPLMLQNAVNEEINKGISGKTVINRYGLIRATLKVYAPNLDTSVKLPRKNSAIAKLPEPDEVIKAVKGTNVELPVLLAMWLSFSLSEMKGLKRSSIIGDYIQVDQVVVYAGKNVEKSLAKVDTRTRRHRIPPYIMELINKLPSEQEYLVPEWGTTINNRLKKALEDNNLPIISIHKCRHLFASISLVKLNLNSEIVKNEGGWSNESTMRNVYTHTFNSDRVEADKKIDEYFNNILNHKNEIKYELFLERLNLEDNNNSKMLYDSYKKIV